MILLFFAAKSDWQTRKIYNHFSLEIFLLGLFTHLFSLCPELCLTDRLIGSLLVSLPMFLLTLFLPGSFGGGDIKLLAASGFFLGWRAMIPAVCIGLLSAAVYIVFQMLRRKLTLKSQIPLGPFLALGLTAGTLWGEAIFAWYLVLF